MIGRGVWQVFQTSLGLHDLVCIDPVVVVAKLETRKHALDERRLARASIAHYPDQPIGIVEMPLSYLLAQEDHTILATWGVVLRRNGVLLDEIVHSSNSVCRGCERLELKL